MGFGSGWGKETAVAAVEDGSGILHSLPRVRTERGSKWEWNGAEVLMSMGSVRSYDQHFQL